MVGGESEVGPRTLLVAWISILQDDVRVGGGRSPRTYIIQYTAEDNLWRSNLGSTATIWETRGTPSSFPKCLGSLYDKAVSIRLRTISHGQSPVVLFVVSESGGSPFLSLSDVIRIVGSDICLQNCLQLSSIVAPAEVPGTMTKKLTRMS